jgi:hypothetical protein
MDANGARQLAARIRWGVSVGMTVELLDPGGDARLSIGDRGVVEGIDDQGLVVVRWERGFTLEIDPERMAVRTLAA